MYVTSQRVAALPHQLATMPPSPAPPQHDVGPMTPTQQQQQPQLQPPSSVSIAQTKGLLNGPGQNNCFLNSAVQVLWHLDIFRRSFRELEGHACMADSCIFCALKELFNQFQYSHESALPPDALRRALAETFANQQRFQLGFMDDAAECFENILLRIHFHVANSESEDMCNAMHCISHQKFAMTLVEQRVCHSCGATSEPLPFTQMVHYISSSALCAQSKMNFDNGNSSERFGQLLRKACGIGEIRDCPSTCGAKIQIHRTLMNHPEIISIGIVWDSERPTLDHIMNVFQTVGTTIRLQDVFHSVVDGQWANSAAHQLVGVVTYYGKHYSTFFFHTKLRVWIYFDDATVREIGPHWEQVVEKCRRGHFQPLLLLYANPCGTPVTTEYAPKTVTYASGHCRSKLIGHMYHPLDKGMNGVHRRAATPNPEVRRDLATELSPRRAVTPNAELHHNELQQQIQHGASRPFATTNAGYISKRHPSDSDAGYSSSDRHPTLSGGTYRESIRRSTTGGDPVAPIGNDVDAHNYYNATHGHQTAHPTTYPASGFQQQQQAIYGTKMNGGPPLRAAGYFNNCDVPGNGYSTNGSGTSPALGLPPTPPTPDKESAAITENIYISRRAVESVLNYQKVQRHQNRHAGGAGSGAAGNRNSNSSLESFENALRNRSMQYNGYYDNGSGRQESSQQQLQPTQQQMPDTVAPAPPSNVPRCRDSGNWSGDRNSASSTSSASMENPYYVMVGNKRSAVPSQGYHYLSNKPQSEGNAYRPGYDAGYDSFSLSSNDSFPHGGHPKHNQLLAQIPENVLDQSLRRAMYKGDSPDECQTLCYEADSFLEKSIEKEQFGDLDGAISLCNGAAAKARAAMDAPYSNPQILAFAKMKHSSCVMRSRSLHRRILARQDSINSHGSSTGTETDSPRKGTDADGADATFGHHHSRQSSRDSTRSRNGHHSRQSSRDGGNGSHSRQGSRDGGSHSRQSSQDASEKKRIELYGTLPKKGGKKKVQDKARTGSIRLEDEAALHRLLLGTDTLDASYTSSSKPEVSYQNGHHIPATQLGAELLKVQRVNEYILQKQQDRALQQQMASSTDYSDYSSEWEHTRKPATLHRTNSIPPNFHHQVPELSNSQSFTDLTSATESCRNKDDANKSNVINNAKLGKKQHKIRRKLLMGGLIRRKNRSMPDLREGQNSNGLPQGSQQTNSLSLEEPDETNAAYQNMYNDVVNRRLYSSHSKIPPPPPVRTTSQLTTRSLSQGNLTTVPGQSLGDIESISPCPPLQPRLVQPSINKSNATLVATKHQSNHIQYPMMISPTLPTNSMNRVTIQADVHHERTPSDNVRPVCLASRQPVSNAVFGEIDVRPQRNMSMSPTQQLMQSDSRQQNVFPYGQVSHQNGLPQSEVTRMAKDNANDVIKGGDGRTQPAQGGLLAELQAKRKQLLESAGARLEKDLVGQSPKSQNTTSDSWLQELQAKQQLLKSKKGTNTDPTTSRSDADPHGATNGFARPVSISQQRDLPPKINPHQLADNADRFSEKNPSVSNITSAPCQATELGEYKPKSVRDLASKFEKHTITPVTPPPQIIQQLSPPIQQHPLQSTIKKDVPLRQPVSDAQQASKPLTPPQWHTGNSHLNGGAQDEVDGRLLVHTLDLHHHDGHRSDLAKDPASRMGLANPIHQVNRVYDYRPGFIETAPQFNEVKNNDYNMQKGTTVVKNPLHMSIPGQPQNGSHGPMSPGVDRSDMYHNEKGASNLDVQHSQIQRAQQQQYNNHIHNQHTNYLNCGLPMKQQDAVHQYSELDYNNQNAKNGWHQQNSHNMQNSNAASHNVGGISVPSMRKISDTGLPEGHRIPEHLSRSHAVQNGMLAMSKPLNSDAPKHVPPSYQNALSMSTMQWSQNSASAPASSVPTTALSVTKSALGTSAIGNHGSLRRNHSVCLPVTTSNKEVMLQSTGQPIDNEFKKKKGKKSVTFSDQIALVASADDDVMLPHPLLEKVLNRTSIMSKPQQPQPRPASTIQVPVFNEASYEHMTNCNTITNGMTSQGASGQYKYEHMQPLPATSVAAQMSNYNGGYSIQSGHQNGNIQNGSQHNGFDHHYVQDAQPKPATVPSTTGGKVPCHLCRKKTVVPPVVYCQDCDFYMSRFKPR